VVGEVTAEPSVRDRAWEVIATVRDASPRVANDASTDDILDALATAGLLAGEADLGERIAARIEHEAATDASPQMLKLCGGTADTDAYWDGVIQGKRRAAFIAREVTP